MLKIKNIILILSLLLFVGNLSAGSMGSIKKYSEYITPLEKNGIIQAVAEGKTNKDGYLYLPLAKKATLLEVKAIKGELLSKAEIKKVYGQKVVVLQFLDKDAAVIVNEKFSVKKLYKGKKAKQKYSHPGNVKNVTYKFKNTAPVKIDKYFLTLAVPKGVELYNVVYPKISKKKKTFIISAKDGYTVVSVKKKKIKQAGEFKVSLNYYAQPYNVKMVVWLFAIFIGGFMLYTRRATLFGKNEEK